jgi:hypothetical protein
VRIGANGSQGAATGLEALFSRTPRQNSSRTLYAKIFSDFGRNLSFSTEYALHVEMCMAQQSDRFSISPLS